MTAWTTTDPGSGDLDGLSGLAAQLDAIARHLAELQEDVVARRVAAQPATRLGGSENRAMRIYTDTRDAFRSPARS